MYIDSHAHLGDEQIFPNWQEMEKRASQALISKIVTICTNFATFEQSQILQKNSPNLFLAAATPPHDASFEGDPFFETVAAAAFQKLLIAIGETGLDYYYKSFSKEAQKKFLVEYLALALKTNLPVIFHCREAFSDLFDICDTEYSGKKAVVHCFTGTLEEGKKAVDRGWMISLSGVVTFKKSTALRQVIAELPLESFLIETDSPYLAPESKRGKVNEPAFLPEVALTIASVKNMAVETVAAKIMENSLKFFAF